MILTLVDLATRLMELSQRVTLEERIILPFQKEVIKSLEALLQMQSHLQTTQHTEKSIILLSAGSNNSISGLISANSGINTITFSGSATTNEITGKLDAQSGKMMCFLELVQLPPNSDISKWKCNLHNH